MGLSGVGIRRSAPTAVMSVTVMASSSYFGRRKSRMPAWERTGANMSPQEINPRTRLAMNGEFISIEVIEGWETDSTSADLKRGERSGCYHVTGKPAVSYRA